MKRTITTPVYAVAVADSKPIKNAESVEPNQHVVEAIVYTPPFETMETAAVPSIVPVAVAAPASEPAKPKAARVKGTQAIVEATENTVWKQQDDDKVVRRLEHALLDAIYSTEKEVVDLQAKIESLGETMAKLKGKLETTWRSRDELLEKLPAQLVSLREGKPLAVPAAELPPAGDTPAPNLAAFTEDDPDPIEVEPAAEPLPERWQDIPTRDLIANVDRLGPARLEAIAGAFPTLLELADARSRARKSGRHFSSEFPKGTGKVIGDSIESALLAMVGRYGDALDEDSHAPVLDPVAETEPKPEPVAKPPAVKAEPKTAEPIKQAEVSLAVDNPRTRTIRAIARSVSAEATEEGLKADAGESWVDGYNAGAAGWVVDDCPVSEMGDVTDWVKGWVYHRLFQRQKEIAAAEATEPAEAAEVEPVQTEPAPQSPPGDYDPVHADFVRQILDWLMSNRGEMKPAAANSPMWWSIGAQCFEEGEPAEECPTEKEVAKGEWANTEEIDQVDWLRGWLSRKLEIEAGAKTTGELIAAPVAPPAAEVATEAEPVEEPAAEVEQPRTLESVFDAVTAEPSPRRPKDFATEFNAGYTAALSERPWLKCPHDPTADLPRAADWMRGWIEGAALDSDL